MNTDHIDHEGFISIPKALKKINSQYRSKLILENEVWEVIPLYSDMMLVMEQQKILTVILIIIKSMANTFKQDPKNIFSLTDRMNFMENKHIRKKNHFMFKFLIM